MKEEEFCSYIFKLLVYIGSMTAFILLRALGPVEKTPRAASNPKRQSWVSVVTWEGLLPKTSPHS